MLFRSGYGFAGRKVGFRRAGKAFSGRKVGFGRGGRPFSGRTAPLRRAGTDAVGRKGSFRQPETKATELTLAPDDVRSVSVIMCSANPARFAEAKARYERLLQGLPHEIVGISDARSLAEGYNRGLAKARNDIVVFAHDDVEIVSPDFAARLLAGLRRHDVVGIAGTCKIEGGAWHFAGHPHLRGQRSEEHTSELQSH